MLVSLFILPLFSYLVSWFEMNMKQEEDEDEILESPSKKARHHHHDDENQSLSSEQEHALDLVLAGKNVFITGAAGTGKSFLLSTLIDRLRERMKAKDQLAVTASTGIAAVNIGGVTLHRFAGIGVDPTKYGTNARLYKSNAWRQVRVLIIDEISMISAELFDALADIAADLRREHRQPFGGIQLVVAGDFLQLAPIGKNAKFCFEAKSWTQCFGDKSQQIVVLKSNYRQAEDGDFLRKLHQIRRGESDVAINNWLIGLKTSNIRTDDSGITKLFSRNIDVDRVNRQYLDAINEREYVYKCADYSGPDKQVALLKYLSQNTLIPSSLALKRGARVMLLRNIDQKAGLVNGSQGVVVRFMKIRREFESFYDTLECDDDDKVKLPVIAFDGRAGEQLILPVETTVEQGELWARRVQLPLKLAWALTIHKSQGLSMDAASISLADVFAPGQAYVALSRLRSENGLKLLDYSPKCIHADKRAVRYYDDLERT